MSGRRGLERYDGIEMSRWLSQECGAEFDRQTGDHVHYKLPDGRRVGSLTGPQKIPTNLARSNAKALGISLAELRDGLGYPNVNAGRPKKRPAVDRKPVKRTVGKQDALRILTETSEMVSSIGDSIRCGQRDCTVYERIYSACVDARQALERAS